jgi:hypothetical protein
MVDSDDPDSWIPWAWSSRVVDLEQGEKERRDTSDKRRDRERMDFISLDGFM